MSQPIANQLIQYSMIFFGVSEVPNAKFFSPSCSSIPIYLFNKKRISDLKTPILRVKSFVIKLHY